MDQIAPFACTNCKQITDASGKTIWICENCGTENTAPQPSVIATPEITPDASAAQAAINAAASALPTASQS